MADTSTSRSDATLFLSPHLDDAVFACGEVITSSPRAVVATLFAGRPPPAAPHTSWDADAGFRPGEDVIGARREEDREALAALGAHPVWLDFCDDQYGASPQAAELVGALEALLASRAVGAVYFPLGLFHADHARTSDAALALAQRYPDMSWRIYAEAIYRRIPHLAQQRAEALARSGFVLSPHVVALDAAAHARKRDAVRCYRSQIKALATRGGHADAFARETCWRVEPAAQRR